ncbi:hypothetical protein IAU60_005621 [Kwoniella sp. DSM 27419]
MSTVAGEGPEGSVGAGIAVAPTYTSAPSSIGSITNHNSIESREPGVNPIGIGVGREMDAEAKKAKGRKNRMKGWAWVVEDEHGNIVDVPETIQPPDDRRTPRQSSASASASASTSAVINNVAKSLDRASRQPSPAPVLVIGADGDSADGGVALVRPTWSAEDTGSEPPDSATSMASVVHYQGPEARSPSPQYSRASTAATENFPSKRSRKSSSPVPNTTTPLPSANEHLNQHGGLSRSDSPAVISAPAQPDVITSAKSDTHPKKRRKTTPPATASPLERSHSATRLPTAAASGSKAKRPRLAGTAPPTRAHQALLVRETLPYRAGSQHVVEDDAPLPPPPPPLPRAGMGEGDYETPKQSAVREETALRQEAAYILNQAAGQRVSEAKRRTREEANGTILVSGKRARKPVNYADSEGDDDSDSSLSGAGPGPSTQSSRRNGANGYADHGEYTPRERLRNDTSAAFKPGVSSQSDFDEKWALLQREHRAIDAAHRAADAERYPGLSSDPEPSIVLAPNGQMFGAPKSYPKDRVERAHADGMAGLSNEMDSDAQGFVENVKINLRSILTYYYPNRAGRREAFCERIGRGLQQFGWELTDSGEGALQP